MDLENDAKFPFFAAIEPIIIYTQWNRALQLSLYWGHCIINATSFWLVFEETLE